jgi:Leucine-rich repeat (LRR) protein
VSTQVNANESRVKSSKLTTTLQHFTAPNPPDPRLFVQAGTSGGRHLYPIHFIHHEHRPDSLLSRSISCLRSRTPRSDACRANIDMIRNISSAVQTLQHFDISQNELHELPLDISQLLELETLNCSHNHLQTMPDLFEQWKHLKELDMSFNIFKQLPQVIYKFKSLTRLNCEHNAIEQLDVNFLHLKRLKVFIADHNQFETLDPIDFVQMKKLEYIHVAHNHLSRFPRGLHRLHYLRNVNLSYNQLRTFPVDLLLVNTLDVLNLSHNSIGKLPAMSMACKRASLIFSIDLSYNQLSQFSDYLLSIAVKVDVSNNKIRCLSNELANKLTNELIVSRELKIHNNPLIQPEMLVDMFNDVTSPAGNVLRMIRTCFDEQHVNVRVRQGFKLSIIGCKSTGKTALTNCLEEATPLIIDEYDEETNERIVQGNDNNDMSHDFVRMKQMNMLFRLKYKSYSKCSY